MISGEVLGARAPQEPHVAENELGTHMQYRLDLLGGGFQLFTATSDEEGVRKAFALLGLHSGASRELFVAKGGKQIWHVGENRQVYPPVRH